LVHAAGLVAERGEAARLRGAGECGDRGGVVQLATRRRREKVNGWADRRIRRLSVADHQEMAGELRILAAYKRYGRPPVSYLTTTVAQFLMRWPHLSSDDRIPIITLTSDEAESIIADIELWSLNVLKHVD
jgi:hypothetical protein